MSAKLDDNLLPPAFVQALSVTAGETLRNWLETNAPKAVSELLSAREAMDIYIDDVAAGNTPAELRHLDIIDAAVEAIVAINELGGTFHGPDVEKFSAYQFKVAH